VLVGALHPKLETLRQPNLNAGPEVEAEVEVRSFGRDRLFGEGEQATPGQEVRLRPPFVEPGPP
jgi:hypothetical protein